MTNVGAGQYVYSEDLLDFSMLERPPLGHGANTYVWPKKGMEAAVYERLRKAHPHVHALRPSDVPARYHWGDPNRAPPLTLTADPGWVVMQRTDPVLKGQHWYDNALREMNAIFIAAGPSIRAGAHVKPFANVDLYSLMAEVVQVTPARTDGSIESLCAVLVEQPEACKGQSSAIGPAVAK